MKRNHRLWRKSLQTVLLALVLAALSTYAYAQDVQTIAAPPPPGGIWVVLLLGVVVIFRDLLKKLLGPIGTLPGFVYRALVWREPGQRRKLQHYRRALSNRYRHVQIPFRPTRPLDMRDIYVPLNVAGSRHNEQIDAYRAILSYQRIVLVGPPGSGKTMLLRHIALLYAEQRLLGLPDNTVPILIKLHRLNNPDISLIQHLLDELERNNVPNAQDFLLEALQEGRIVLLLDGLDEVSSSHRPRVCQQIEELAHVFNRCRLVITCRDALYNNEFVDLKACKLDLIELNDQQIRRFLHSWERDMRDNNVSIEHLMQTLRDQSQILALARNPLLLTIIAYLYTDTSFVLPTSRAEFYRKATDILLDQWHQERNQYEGRHKRLVLQKLALFSQDNAAHQQQGSGMTYPAALHYVRRILPALNLNPDQDAAPLLNEIIERSSLLLRIDGGVAIQFAHVTVQEFFAAAELSDNAEGLLSRFRADQDAWRETVKLWCGLAKDSTALIQTVYSIDAITALECLSNAQQVDHQLALRIINAFKTLLGITTSGEAIVRAFGTVASDRSPRGQAVFAFLEETLITAEKASRRMAAASALSLTNLPQAATILTASYAISPDEVRTPLVRMGDVAVTALASLSTAGLLETLDDLHAIGTTHAAEALIPMLWKADERMSGRAAWCLSALLSHPHIEHLLRHCPLSDEQRKAEQLEWIWKPFGESAGSSLPTIAGRLAYLLSHAPEETIPTRPLAIDPRLAIPLCSVQSRRELGRLESLNPSEREWIACSITTLRQEISAGQETTDALQTFLSQTFVLLQASSRWQYLATSLEPRIQLNMVMRLVNGPPPTARDWRNIYRPLKHHHRPDLRATHTS